MDNNNIEFIKAITPIAKTLIWIIVIIVILIIWRKGIYFFVKGLSEKILKGGTIEFWRFKLEIKEDISKVSIRQDDHENMIHAIKIALSGIINKYEIEHLKKLFKETDDSVKYGPHFKSEIEHLDAIGFLMPTKSEGLRVMEKFNAGEEFHLREYTRITEKGKEYLDNISKLGLIVK